MMTVPEMMAANVSVLIISFEGAPCSCGLVAEVVVVGGVLSVSLSSGLPLLVPFTMRI